ncbi:MAG: response regulator [Armatimonadota bacterium]|nr:response regulator [Armatimonadota bacterium]
MSDIIRSASDAGGRTQNPLRVLIVEDEPNNQVLLQKVLTRLGYAWECVDDGVKAVAAAAAGDFALILMDMSLPEMDGWQATRLIREAGNKVPIVATSAHAMVGDQQKALGAGCNEYVTKPFDLPTLRKTVTKYAPLEGR